MHAEIPAHLHVKCLLLLSSWKVSVTTATF